MPGIFDSIKEHAEFDIRKGFPDLMAKLGVNQADERAVVHATLAYILKAIEAGIVGEVG